MGRFENLLAFGDIYKHVETAAFSLEKVFIFFTKDVAVCKLHVNTQLDLVPHWLEAEWNLFERKSF